MNILLTNDDGWNSPLLPFTADYLREMGDLTIALPQEEQSWTGKAMTRFGRLQVEERELCGVTGYSINGRPADCVNLALNHLCPKLPDLIVSGINMGSNLGVSFIVSSGTVGACLEANIAGVPGIALSQCLQPETYRQWADEQHLPAATVDDLCRHQREFLDAALADLRARDDAFSKPITWNVNMPHTPDDNWSVVHTNVGRTSYGSCFVRDEATGDYRHDLQKVDSDDDPTSDGVVSYFNGHVSISRIDIWQLGR